MSSRKRRAWSSCWSTPAMSRNLPGRSSDVADAQVERVIAPFADQLDRLQTIPGVGQRTAEVVIAEIGVDMGRLPTSGHLASWAGLCPGHHESGGKPKSGRARKGNQALRVALC